MTNNLEKWQSLLNQLNVVNEPGAYGLDTVTQEQLKIFENFANIVLPQAYKEFCQIFGSGRFGYTEFFIDYPDPEDMEGHLISNSEINYACKCGWKGEKIVEDILDRGYLFGGGAFYVSFVFDLTTYSEQDL